MTPRENFIRALEGKQPVGRVPHFELVFFLTMEAFGKVFPGHRVFHQWDQMTDRERRLHIDDVGDTYRMMAETYEHSAIFYHGGVGGGTDGMMAVFDRINQTSGGRKYFTMIHGDATSGMANGENMVEYVVKLTEQAQEVKDDYARRVDGALANAAKLKTYGLLDGFALCADYCFNTGPFLSPAMFDEFVTPYLARLTKGYREMGFYTIKHTDGNIMPILDSLVSTNPHALHSLDPQGGVDIAELKKRIGKKVCLIGNVNCGLLDTGTDEQAIESARYALKHGMPGGGYIFSTSNCVYTGMDLRRYDLILDVWRKEGNYPA